MLKLTFSLPAPITRPILFTFTLQLLSIHSVSSIDHQPRAFIFRLQQFLRSVFAVFSLLKPQFPLSFTDLLKPLRRVPPNPFSLCLFIHVRTFRVLPFFARLGPLLGPV